VQSRLRAALARLSGRGAGAPLLLLVFALALRLVYAWELRGNPFFDAPVVDAKTFLDQALAIAAGELWGGSEPFWQAPGYIYFLASLCWLFPDSYFFAVRVAQAIVGSLSCLLVVRLADRAFGSRRLALSAGAAAAAYGGLVQFEAELLAVGLEIFLYLLLLDRILHALTARDDRSWLMAGLVGGLAAITRPNILLFLALLMPWLARLRLEQDAQPAGLAATLRPLFLSGFGLMAVVLSVTVRNVVVGGDVVLISANGGVNFHIGNNADQDRAVAIPPGIAWEEMVTEPVRAGFTLPSQRSAYFYRKALSYIAAQPGDYAALMASKLYQFWSGPELKRNQDVYYARRHSQLLSWLLWDRGLSFPFGIVGPLAMAGLVLTWRRREPAVRLLRLFALSYMAAVLLFFVTARYRMPAIPVLLIFAAWTCRQLVIDWRGGRYRSFAALGGAVAVLTVVLNLPAATVPEDDAQLHFDLGEVYLRKGEYQRSAQNSLAALELTSGQYNYARHNLAVAYFHLGRHRDAVQEGQRAVEENPRRADTRVLLGRAYGAMDQPGQAAAQFERALQLMPGSGMAHYYYGRLLYRSGRHEQAITHLAVARAQSPQDFWISYELARCHQHLGQLEEALALFQASRQIEERAEALNAIGAVYFQRGNLPRARGFFERALGVASQNLEAGVNLGLVDLEDGRVADAVQQLERIAAMHPHSKLALRTLIAAYEAGGNDAGAARVRRKLSSILNRELKHQ
jgi:tetratricopeptide (TPR) repeat protein